MYSYLIRATTRLLGPQLFACLGIYLFILIVCLRVRARNTAPSWPHELNGITRQKNKAPKVTLKSGQKWRFCKWKYTNKIGSQFCHCEDCKNGRRNEIQHEKKKWTRNEM